MRLGAEPCADRVRPDVLARVRQVLVVPDQLGVESLLEQVSDATVPSVELLRVDPVEALHPTRKRVAIAFHDRMEVVRHQAESLHPQLFASDDATEQRHEEPIVLSVPVDDAPVHPAHGHMEDPVVRKNVPRQPSHSP
jgi:hypothetical protein